MDSDGLLRGQELGLLLQHHLWFYLTVSPRKEGAMVGAEPAALRWDWPRVGGSAGFHPALQAQFSKALKLVLVIKFVLKGFTELGPLLAQ